MASVSSLYIFASRLSCFLICPRRAGGAHCSCSSRSQFRTREILLDSLGDPPWLGTGIAKRSREALAAAVVSVFLRTEPDLPWKAGGSKTFHDLAHSQCHMIFHGPMFHCHDSECNCPFFLLAWIRAEIAEACSPFFKGANLG